MAGVDRDDLRDGGGGALRLRVVRLGGHHRREHVALLHRGRAFVGGLFGVEEQHVGVGDGLGGRRVGRRRSGGGRRRRGGRRRGRGGRGAVVGLVVATSGDGRRCDHRDAAQTRRAANHLVAHGYTLHSIFCFISSRLTRIG
ncbi:hypothetical protein C5E51_05660 [Nocardia nova]|nr:hypothetical protein C5E51_05660 [Nocardia nova]